MISEVHAGGVSSATYATEKDTSLVAPATKESANIKEQAANQNTSPSTIVSLGNNAKTDLLTYSKQTILESAITEAEDGTLDPSSKQTAPLAAEPDITTNAFGGTKKPPP